MRIQLFGDIWGINENIKFDKSLTEAELSICDLETPVTDAQKGIVKAGPCLKSSLENFKKIRNNFPNKFMVSIANNHTGDFGEDGINDTINACKETQTIYGGVSNNNQQEPMIIQQNGVSIAVFCIAEKQFGVSQRSSIGVDYFSPNLYQKIRQAKATNDIVIVSIHAAAEMSRWPSPQIQELFRSYIDCGADIIHGHHAHVPQGWEEYHNGLILYGLGNFVVSPQRWSQRQNGLWSLSVTIEIVDKKVKSFQIIPVIINSVDNDTIEIKAGNINSYADYIAEANYPINNSNALEALWQEFAMIMFETHYGKSLKVIPPTPKNITIKDKISDIKLVASGKYDKFLCRRNQLSKQDYAVWYHLFDCLSHQSAIETALGILSGQLTDLRTPYSKKMLEKYFQSL